MKRNKKHNNNKKTTTRNTTTIIKKQQTTKITQKKNWKQGKYRIKTINKKEKRKNEKRNKT